MNDSKVSDPLLYRSDSVCSAVSSTLSDISMATNEKSYEVAKRERQPNRNYFNFSIIFKSNFQIDSYIRLSGRSSRDVVPDCQTNFNVFDKTLSLFRCEYMLITLRKCTLILINYIETNLSRLVSRSIGGLY